MASDANAFFVNGYVVVRLNDDLFFDDHLWTTMQKADGVNSALEVHMPNKTGTDSLRKTDESQVSTPAEADAAAASKLGGRPVQHDGAKKIEGCSVQHDKKVTVADAMTEDCPVVKDAKEESEVDNVYDQRIDPTNLLPYNPNQDPNNEQRYPLPQDSEATTYLSPAGYKGVAFYNKSSMGQSWNAFPPVTLKHRFGRRDGCLPGLRASSRSLWSIRDRTSTFNSSGAGQTFVAIATTLLFQT
ncbi:hypothetical protein PF007_g27570 [Phytophthora fragariae]|uniref:Uncharacterized protein n=1 Tax=Phytophthora fragariae TaxID=53985 RepID=A0A6A3Q4P3_9STRA|nr:hypothetical protein PF007_g27570 [Phytophthora fragariae]